MPIYDVIVLSDEKDLIGNIDDVMIWKRDNFESFILPHLTLNGKCGNAEDYIFCLRRLLKLFLWRSHSFYHCFFATVTLSRRVS